MFRGDCFIIKEKNTNAHQILKKDSLFFKINSQIWCYKILAVVGEVPEGPSLCLIITAYVRPWYPWLP